MWARERRVWTRGGQVRSTCPGLVHTLHRTALAAQDASTSSPLGVARVGAVISASLQTTQEWARAGGSPPGHGRCSRPATIRLPRCRRAFDERRDARAEGARRAPAQKILPHRVHRRCHPRPPLRRLRPRAQHHRVPARVQAGHRTPRAPHETVRRQRCERPLPAARARVRETRHRAHPPPPLSARRKGKHRALLPHPARRSARPPHRRGHREPSHVEPHRVGLGRGRVPPLPPPRTRRAHPPRPVGPRRPQRALSRPRHRPRRPLPLRSQRQRAAASLSTTTSTSTPTRPASAPPPCASPARRSMAR